MRAKVRQRCPVLIEFSGQVIKSDIVASFADQPADVAIKLREHGWAPYRVRFDDAKAAWVASALR